MQSSGLFQLLWTHCSYHNLALNLETHCYAVKGPRTLQLKLQKKSLSSIHTTTFFHNCNDFFNSFIYGQRFLQRFFQKNLCENLCSVRGPLEMEIAQMTLKNKT